MRVISGIAKGRILLGPPKNKKTPSIRPVLDKVKAAIFNILYNVEAKTVLDLFAGTGAIGIESLSRGADQTVFVDSGDEALKIIRKNLERCRFENIATVLKARIPRDLGRVAKKFGAFDLIFVDPPYDKDLVNPTLAAIAREKLLAPSGIVVVEHSPRERIDEGVGLRLKDRRKYGQTVISFLCQL